MSEEYGANFITVTDDDGNEFELEHLDTIEYNGQTYLAFFPAEHEGEEAQNEGAGPCDPQDRPGKRRGDPLHPRQRRRSTQSTTSS